MKDRKNKIETEVQKTLQSFSKLEKIAPSPHFYTKLKARIESGQSPRKPEWIGFRSPLLRPALIIVITLLNIASAILLFSTNGFTSTARSENLSTFAEEYALTVEVDDLLSTNE